MCVYSQLSQEQEKEERKLREAREKAVEDLHAQLKDKQVGTPCTAHLHVQSQGFVIVVCVQ